MVDSSHKFCERSNAMTRLFMTWAAVVRAGERPECHRYGAAHPDATE